MTAVLACWHAQRAARTAIRRAIPRPGRAPRLTICRSPRALLELLETTLVDAIVFDVVSAPDPLFAIPRAYASIPTFGYGAFHSDSGRLLVRCNEAGLAGVFAEGVDDQVLWPLLGPRTASARRRGALADAPRLLRLTEPLQLGAWSEVLVRAGGPLRTMQVAGALHVSREHLSREFSAGGAPHLKRVIDLVRAIHAADLLQSPAYSVGSVSRILGYRSVAHLSSTARRVAGTTATGLRALGLRGVLQGFLAGRTRSRL